MCGWQCFRHCEVKLATLGRNVVGVWSGFLSSHHAICARPSVPGRTSSRLLASLSLIRWLSSFFARETCFVRSRAVLTLPELAVVADGRRRRRHTTAESPPLPVGGRRADKNYSASLIHWPRSYFWLPNEIYSHILEAVLSRFCFRNYVL